MAQVLAQVITLRTRVSDSFLSRIRIFIVLAVLLPLNLSRRDTARPDAWPFPTTRIIKMFLYLSDVTDVCPSKLRVAFSRSSSHTDRIVCFWTHQDGGPLGVVPMSHRLPCGPWETLRCSFKSSMTLDAAFHQVISSKLTVDTPTHLWTISKPCCWNHQEQMPNHYKFSAPAGTALLFDVRYLCDVSRFSPFGLPAL